MYHTLNSLPLELRLDSKKHITKFPFLWVKQQETENGEKMKPGCLFPGQCVRFPLKAASFTQEALSTKHPLLIKVPAFALKIKVGPGLSAITSDRILQHFCICFQLYSRVCKSSLIKCAKTHLEGRCFLMESLRYYLEMLKIWVKDMHVLCHPEIPLLVIHLIESHAYMHQDMTKAVHWSTVCNSPKLGGRQGECSKSVEGINKLGQKILHWNITFHKNEQNTL